MNFKINFKIIFLILYFSEPNLLVRACNQLGQFLSNRETNLRYLALESMCLLANSEFSHEAVKKHQEVVILSMKVSFLGKYSTFCNFYIKFGFLLDGKRCFGKTASS